MQPKDNVDKIAEAIIEYGKINVNLKQLNVFKDAVRESFKAMSAA